MWCVWCEGANQSAGLFLSQEGARVSHAAAAVGHLVSALLHRGDIGLGVLRDASLDLARRDLAVRGNVEHDEENQVRAEDDTPHPSRQRLAGAAADVRQPWVVDTDVVVIACEVDET